MSHRRTAAAVAVGLLSAAAMIIAGSSAALATIPTATTALVSRDSGAAGAVAQGSEPALNGNGRYVAFESTGNFAGLNPSGFLEVWLRDRTLNTTLLVSRLTGANGAAADSGSGGASVSADGRYVVFDSIAANLVTTPRTTRCNGKAGTAQDVFLRDTVAGTTKLISHAVGLPTTQGNDISTDPLISPDGSTITFTSDATNLTSEPQSNPGCGFQVVAYRVATDTATIVSRASNVGPVLGAEANAISDSRGAMSADGNLVAFSSGATNLTADLVSKEEVFVRDLTTGTTTLVSRANGIAGAPSDGDCGHPTITLDGNLVAMSCSATNLAAGTSAEDVYIRNLSANTIALLSTQSPGGTPSTGASSPVMSNDGSVVVYESEDSTVNGGSSNAQAVATDVASGVNTIVSRSSGPSGAIGDDDSTDIAINGDGSAIAFESLARNLTADTPAGAPAATAFAFVVGAAPLAPTPTPTPVPVPAAGINQSGGVESGLGLLAVVAGIAMALAAATLSRRRPGPLA